MYDPATDGRATSCLTFVPSDGPSGGTQMAFDKLRRLMGSRADSVPAALESDPAAVGPDDDATSSRVTVRGWDPRTKEPIVGSASASGREASGAATVGGPVEPPVDEPSGL